MNRIIFIIFFFALSVYAECQPSLAISYANGQITPSFMARPTGERFSGQISLLNLTIAKDVYNDGKYRISLYQLYGFVGILPFYFIAGGESEYKGIFPDSSIAKKIFQVPLILIAACYAIPNSQLHLHLSKYDTTSKKNIIPSVFIGFQTDYYNSGTDYNWLRFSPRIGFELLHQFNGFCLAGEIGFSRYFDFISNHADVAENHFFITIKYIDM